MRTTIRMNEALAAEAKSFAGSTGRSFTQLVEESLRYFLSERPEPKRERIEILRHHGSRPVGADEVQWIIDNANDEDDFHQTAIIMGYQRPGFREPLPPTESSKDE